jgi:hypothetical protein
MTESRLGTGSVNGSRYRRTKTVPKKKRTSYFKKLSGGLEASFGTGRYRYVFWNKKPGSGSEFNEHGSETLLSTNAVDPERKVLAWSGHFWPVLKIHINLLWYGHRIRQRDLTIFRSQRRHCRFWTHKIFFLLLLFNTVHNMVYRT